MKLNQCHTVNGLQIYNFKTWLEDFHEFTDAYLIEPVPIILNTHGSAKSHYMPNNRKHLQNDSCSKKAAVKNEAPSGTSGL